MKRNQGRQYPRDFLNGQGRQGKRYEGVGVKTRRVFAKEYDKRKIGGGG